MNRLGSTMSSDLPATANCLLSLDHIVWVYQTDDWTLDPLCYDEPLDPIWRWRPPHDHRPDPSSRIALLTMANDDDARLWRQRWRSQAHDLWQRRRWDDDDRPTLHDRRRRPRPPATTVNVDDNNDHRQCWWWRRPQPTTTMTTVNADDDDDHSWC